MGCTRSKANSAHAQDCERAKSNRLSGTRHLSSSTLMKSRVAPRGWDNSSCSVASVPKAASRAGPGVAATQPAPPRRRATNGAQRPWISQTMWEIQHTPAPDVRDARDRFALRSKSSARLRSQSASAASPSAVNALVSSHESTHDSPSLQVVVSGQTRASSWRRGERRTPFSPSRQPSTSPAFDWRSAGEASAADPSIAQPRRSSYARGRASSAQERSTNDAVLATRGRGHSLAQPRATRNRGSPRQAPATAGTAAGAVSSGADMLGTAVSGSVVSASRWGRRPITGVVITGDDSDESTDTPRSGADVLSPAMALAASATPRGEEDDIMADVFGPVHVDPRASGTALIPLCTWEEVLQDEAPQSPFGWFSEPRSTHGEHRGPSSLHSDEWGVLSALGGEPWS